MDGHGEGGVLWGQWVDMLFLPGADPGVRMIPTDHLVLETDSPLLATRPNLTRS